MNKRFAISNLSIKINFLVPIFFLFLIVFSAFISFIVADQSSKKRKEFDATVANFSELITTNNVSNLWNFDTVTMEQNLTSFLKNKEIISIEIKDLTGNSTKKVEKEKREKLISKTLDIVREDPNEDPKTRKPQKIGTAEIIFTDFYIRQDIGNIVALLILLGIILLALMQGSLVVITNYLTAPIGNLTNMATRIAEGDSGIDMTLEKTRSSEIAGLAAAFGSMTMQLRHKAEEFKKTNELLSEIIAKAKQIVVSLNSASREIEAASQEQMSSSNEHASGVTEVSATLQELTITAKQITSNVGELVFSSEEGIKLLRENEQQLLHTVTQLDDVGTTSKTNTAQIGELGKRSAIINEMVELIKEVANKTNILSINASIEASRSGEAGAGFSVVAAEIRELSKETIESAKKAEVAAREIRELLDSIIISSENESVKVIGSGKTAKEIFDKTETIVSRINNNYTFTQKIDVSIKQQENGSIQAAETMRQMAEIARQSAETARQTLTAAKDIVAYSSELEQTVSKFSPGT
jgi:methyl-accepting chemotaxis protein